MNRYLFITGSKQWLISCSNCGRYKDNCSCRIELMRIAAGLINPIRRPWDYQGIFRQAVRVERLPDEEDHLFDEDLPIEA